MLRHLFTLTVLSYSVWCQFAPNERQLNEGAEQGTGNAWQYCNDTCEVNCEPCQKHIECGEGQKLCGYGPIRKAKNGYELKECPRDEECVDDDCYCPEQGCDGEDCPIICNAHCHNVTQLECDGGVDKCECKIQNFCVEKGHGTTGQVCPGFCPVKCKDTENKCEVPADPITGCAVPPLCIPKGLDNTGKPCSYQQCPLICQVTEHLCFGKINILDGCKEEDKCVTKGVSKTGELCPGTCPLSPCENGWIKCDGVIDYTAPFEHCKGQDVCHVKCKNYNEVYCPETSACHDCPKTCPPDEVLCPAPPGSLGCKGEEVCVKRSKDKEDKYCPATADCPTVCKEYEVNCDGGINTITGCKNPDLCIEQKRDFNDDLCTVHCPEVCKDDQVFCPGKRNPINGCFGPDQCKDKGEHLWGPTPKDPCPGWCPHLCTDHEILCPSQVDPCNGCVTEESCREAIKDINGVFCPGKEFTLRTENEDFRKTGNRRGGYLSASHNCPVYCREDTGQVQCRVYEDDKGCKPEAVCSQRDTTSDEKEWCPSTSNCPKQCPSHQKLCHYEDRDDKGCKVEDMCVDRDKDNQGNLCDMDWCPPICTAVQALVWFGDDEIGCKKAPSCLGMGYNGAGLGAGLNE